MRRGKAKRSYGSIFFMVNSPMERWNTLIDHGRKGNDMWKRSSTNSSKTRHKLLIKKLLSTDRATKHDNAFKSILATCLNFQGDRKGWYRYLDETYSKKTVRKFRIKLEKLKEEHKKSPEKYGKD